MISLDNIINYGIDSNKIIGSGSFGIVINNFDGTATKYMRFDTTDPYPIIKIKELNLDNFYKIYDILVLNNGKKDYLKAYQMEVIRDDKIKLIKASIDFFITNIKILMNSLRVLSDNYILVNDLYDDNLIINNDGMYVIDCDSYKYLPDYNKDLLYYNNIEYLKKTIFEHLYRDASIIKRKKLCKLFEENDLEMILNKVSNSSSVLEYLKK